MSPSSISQKQVYASELELLLCCARTQVDSALSKQIDVLLKKNLDWTFLAQFSALHGIVPLFNQNLQLSSTTIVPKEVLGYFKSYSYQTAIQNTIFAKELFKILNLFKQHSISALTFKGPALATSAYGNLGLRQFCDLDILVNAQDFLTSFDLLVTHGYQPTYQWNFLNQEFETSLRQSKSEYSLKNGNICIDLHQNLTVERFLSSSFTFDHLWSHRQSVAICGQKVEGFGNEDLLLYLCIHGSKDCWRRLKWICDVSEFIGSHPELCWENIFQRAEHMGCSRMLLLGLILTQSTLGTRYPAIVEQKIDRGTVSQKLAHEFSDRLFLPHNSLGRKFTAEKFFLHLQMTETPQDKLACYLDLFRPIYAKVILKLVPTIQDQEFITLPRSLFFLYYFIRPIRLIQRRLYRSSNT